MNNVTHTLHDAIKRQLDQEEFDLVGIIPIPAQSDRMVRSRTLQEIIEEFEDSSESGTVEYLVQIKPKKQTTSPQTAVPNVENENLYLLDGKLNIPYLLRNGEILFKSAEYQLARNIYSTVLKSGEFTGTALQQIARCFEAEGKVSEACTHYEESIAYEPVLTSYQKLSSLMMRQGKDQEAAEVIERALNLKDLTQEVRFELHKAAGNCWTRAKKTSEAEKHFKKALEIRPSGDEIRSNLGALYLQDRKTLEAKRYFRDALASNPSNYHALFGLGSCMIAEGDKKAAYDFFVQSLEIEVNNPAAIFNLVKCAYEIKNYAKAASILQKYVETAPVNSNLLYSLAGLQYHLGRISEAKATTQRILELQPQHSGAKDLLSLIERYAASSNG